MVVGLVAGFERDGFSVDALLRSTGCGGGREPRLFSLVVVLVLIAQLLIFCKLCAPHAKMAAL